MRAPKSKLAKKILASKDARNFTNQINQMRPGETRTIYLTDDESVPYTVKAEMSYSVEIINNKNKT